MSTGGLRPPVTGDHSLDDFLDDGERADPADQDDTGEAGDSAEADAGDHPDGGKDVDAAEPATDAAAGSADASAPDDGATDLNGSDAGDADDDAAEEDSIDPESVDPAEPTYDWSPDGAACAACGETTTTRWRQDGAYVCADCKEW
jgi:hypothetical protein